MKAGNNEYQKAADLPDALPILIDETLWILPGTYVPFIVSSKPQITLIEDSLLTDKLIGVLQAKSKASISTENNTKANDTQVYDMGCIARITSFSELGDGKITISLEGICRFKCGKELKTQKPYPSFMITPILEDFYHKTITKTEQKLFIATINKLLPTQLHNFSSEIATNYEKIVHDEIAMFSEEPFDILVNSLCLNAGLSRPEQQLLLEANDIDTRASLLIALAERSLMKKNKISSNILQ